MDKTEFEKYCQSGDLVVTFRKEGDRLSRNTIGIGIYIPSTKNQNQYYLSESVSFDGLGTEDPMGFARNNIFSYEATSDVIIVKTAKDIASMGEDIFGPQAHTEYMNYISKINGLAKRK